MEYKVSGLNDLSKQFSDFQTKMGFTDSNVTQRLMLTASEIFEAFEAYRKDNRAFKDLTATGTIYDIENPERYVEGTETFSAVPDYWKSLFEKHIKDTLEDEIADTAIRLLAFCGENNIDIEKHIKLKMVYNELRGYKYGGKRF